MRPSSIPLFNGSCHIKKPNLVLNGIVTVFLCSGNKICMLSTGCTTYCIWKYGRKIDFYGWEKCKPCFCILLLRFRFEKTFLSFSHFTVPLMISLPLKVKIFKTTVCQGTVIQNMYIYSHDRKETVVRKITNYKTRICVCYLLWQMRWTSIALRNLVFHFWSNIELTWHECSCMPQITNYKENIQKKKFWTYFRTVKNWVNFVNFDIL